MTTQSSCVHFWRIDSSNIGVCKRCGLIKDFHTGNLLSEKPTTVTLPIYSPLLPTVPKPPPIIIERRPVLAQPLITPTPKPVSAQCEHDEPKPAYHRDRPYKRGHYTKSATQISVVCDLYNKGYGIRQVAKETKIARNTVRAIIQEQDGKGIDLNLARQNRYVRHCETTQSLCYALRGLAVAWGDIYTNQQMFDHVCQLLTKYLERDPLKTVTELIPDVAKGKTFSEDDLINAALAKEIGYIAERIPGVIKLDDNTYQLPAHE